MSAQRQDGELLAHGGYWTQAGRPLTSLMFVIPMLLLYEAAMIWLGPAALRNGADLWLRDGLSWFGFSQHLLLPLLTCWLLLAWHHAQRHQWRFRWSTCYGMLLESMLFGWLLLALAELQCSLFPLLTAQIPNADGQRASLAALIGFLGAGIYEELLFRLMMLPCAAAILKGLGLSSRTSWAGAILATSLLFAAAHYQLEFTVAGYPIGLAHGDAFDWFSFSFRFLAGITFALLFVYRGFGIAAGSHALYDVLAAAL